jgi:hypothetical protein
LIAADRREMEEREVQPPVNPAAVALGGVSANCGRRGGRNAFVSNGHRSMTDE